MTSVTTENFYAYFSLTSSASFDDIKKTFRRMALLLHSDKNSADSESFKKLTFAYKILQNPEFRSSLDFALRHGHQEFFINDSVEPDRQDQNRFGPPASPTDTSGSSSDTTLSSDESASELSDIDEASQTPSHLLDEYLSSGSDSDTDTGLFLFCRLYNPCNIIVLQHET